MLKDIMTNFGVSTAVIAACLFLLWAIGMMKKDASIIDIFWGAGFGVIAFVCLNLAGVATPYLKLLAALPILWAIRLSVYLAIRNLPHGEDFRYQEMRRKVGPEKWAMWSLTRIYMGQGIAMLLVAAPLYVGMATGRTTEIGFLAVAGATIWLIGFLFEAVGDWQLTRFVKSMKSFDGPYEDKPVLDTGLWKFTRHPNYFGNAALWWGIWLVACQAPWGWVTIFAPIAMTYFLMKVTGAKHLEKTLKKRPAYQAYVQRTPEFFPWFPKKP
jgi:steroid 5-alpha reductase family enzyme